MSTAIEPQVQEVQDVPELDLTKYQAPTPAELYTKDIVAEVTLAEATLEAFTKEAEGLTIAGLDDKDGYERLQKVLTKGVKGRTRIEKVLKAARDPFNDASKKIATLFNKIEAAYKKIETPLASEKKKIDDEQKRIEQKKIDDELARVRGLQDQLRAFGCLRTVEEIAVMSDEEFSGLLAQVKKDFEDAADTQRKKDEEIEQLRRDNELLRAQQPASPAGPSSGASFGPSVSTERTNGQSEGVPTLIPLPNLIAAIRKWSSDNNKPVMENLNASTIRLICKDLGIATEAKA